MKKLLFSLLMGANMVALAQVSNPEKTRTLLAATGWTAVTSSIATPSSTNTGDKAIDGNLGTWWETSNTASTAAGQTITVTMGGANVAIDGVTLAQRLNGTYTTGGVASCKVYTSVDGQNFMQQGGIYVLGDANNKLVNYIDFPSTITCQAYRVEVVSTVGGGVANIAEALAYTSIVYDDNKTHNRALWRATSTNFFNGNFPGETLDGLWTGVAGLWPTGDDSFWGVNWGTPQPFPHVLSIDMGESLTINKVSYIQRSYGPNQRSITTGNLIFSDDASFSTIKASVPFTWNIQQGTLHTFNLGQTVNARYVRISATGNSGGNGLGSTCLSEFYTGMDSTLPVSLTSFEAKPNGSQVSLTWKTSSEQNSDYFQVLRSGDGVNFAPIGGKIAAAGNSNEEKTYHFTDFSPQKGINYYRLNQYDKDGTLHAQNLQAHASIVAPGLEIASATSVSGGVELNIYSPKPTSATVWATNVMGQTQGQVKLVLASGYTKVTVPTNASGLIIATVATATGKVSKKMAR